MLGHAMPRKMYHDASRFRSKQARVSAPQKSGAPDVVYDTDLLHKEMLWTSVQNSPIQYANLGKNGVKRATLRAPTSCPDTLGPGSYDAPVAKDVRVSLMLNQNALSRCVILQRPQPVDQSHVQFLQWHIVAPAWHQGRLAWQLMWWIQRATLDLHGGQKMIGSTGIVALLSAKRSWIDRIQ